MELGNYWNYTFKEINMFCITQSIKQEEEFKRQIQLQEAVTNKLLQADAMLNKKPKIINLTKIFKNLF